MIREIIKYIAYKFNAKHKHGYGIHSPFAFDLITKVIENKFIYEEYNIIENHRKALLQNNEPISNSTLGAPSKAHRGDVVKVSDLVKSSSISNKNGKLLFRLVRHYQPDIMLELGTSVGLSSLYISKGNPLGTLYTIEGNKHKLNLAAHNFETWKCKNINYLLGDFDDILTSLLNNLTKLDLVFFDGNHKKVPTIHYFEICLKLINDKSVFIFDDIHWSAEMEATWQAIKEYKEVVVTFDLFHIGLVFFRNGLQKQDYVIKF